MKFRSIKYLLAFLIPYSVAMSLMDWGMGSFHAVILAFGIIPVLELIFKPNPHNLEKAEQEMVKKDRFYDILLYMSLPLQYIFMIWFFFAIRDTDFSSLEFWGKTFSFGILCGAFGINVAHELGHRNSAWARFSAKALLLTTLYPHFYIEHNFGHHRNVGTIKDPASARYNENLYTFWIRSIWYSYWSAWKLENTRIKRRNFSFIHHQMIWFLVLKVMLLSAVWVLFGAKVLMAFIVSASVGILMLETVNYLEHYGLRRKKINEKRYEKTRPVHSWNSDHIMGRIMLFELTRHSDHHAYPEKKYQTLDHHDESPQLPTGYPGMMLLALVPPLWFAVMNKRVKSALDTNEFKID